MFAFPDFRELTSGIDTLLLNLSVNRVLASADRLVLIVHDRPSTRRRIVAKITGESGNGGDDNDHTELAAFLACTHTCIDDRTANLVEHGSLLVASGGDWGC